jgi:hypothetical protein
MPNASSKASSIVLQAPATFMKQHPFQRKATLGRGSRFDLGRLIGKDIQREPACRIAPRSRWRRLPKQANP